MCIVALDFSPARWQQLSKVHMCNKLYIPPRVLNHCVGSNLFFKSLLTSQLVSWHLSSLHHLATDASYLCTDAEYPPNPNISLVFWTNWANTVVIKIWIIRKLTWLLSQLILILYNYILFWTILYSSHFFGSCKCISLLNSGMKSYFADNINDILKGWFPSDFKELQCLIGLILPFIQFAHYVDPFTTTRQEEKPYTKMNKDF